MKNQSLLAIRALLLVTYFSLVSLGQDQFSSLNTAIRAGDLVGITSDGADQRDQKIKMETGMIINQYKIISAIGKSGMGEVLFGAIHGDGGSAGGGLVKVRNDWNIARAWLRQEMTR